MDAQTILLPVFSLCGVAIGAGLQYLFGRSLEARKQLTLQKSQSYIDYFKAMAALAQTTGQKDGKVLAADAKVRICLGVYPTDAGMCPHHLTRA